MAAGVGAAAGAGTPATEVNNARHRISGPPCAPPQGAGSAGCVPDRREWPGIIQPIRDGVSRELLGILRGLAGCHLVGADVVEVSPAYDHAELTSIAAAHVCYDLLALMLLGKR